MRELFKFKLNIMWEKQYTFYSFILYLFKTRNLSYVAHLAKVMSSPVTFTSFQSISQPISVPIFTRKQASTTFTFSGTINTKIFFQSAQLWHIFFMSGPRKISKTNATRAKHKKKIIRQNLQNLNKNPMSSTNANEERVKT